MKRSQAFAAAVASMVVFALQMGGGETAYGQVEPPWSKEEPEEADSKTCADVLQDLLNDPNVTVVPLGVTICDDGEKKLCLYRDGIDGLTGFPGSDSDVADAMMACAVLHESVHVWDDRIVCDRPSNAPPNIPDWYPFPDPPGWYTHRMAECLAHAVEVDCLRNKRDQAEDECLEEWLQYLLDRRTFDAMYFCQDPFNANAPHPGPQPVFPTPPPTCHENDDEEEPPDEKTD